MNFRVRLTEAENADHTHAAETVHYIVMPAGSGQFLSTNSNYRFSTGVGSTISSSIATSTFSQKYAVPSIFAAAQGDVDTTIDTDGFYDTAAATDLDPIVVRFNNLTAASVGLVADEDNSGVTNNTHTAEAQAWMVVQGA
ncbi:MAG: H-type lectin protein, partial [Verrucomicrobiaceae bacterium]|nr:H-type lectin protein [Verrucomicrobiaceae bacterium]